MSGRNGGGDGSRGGNATNGNGSNDGSEGHNGNGTRDSEPTILDAVPVLERRRREAQRVRTAAERARRHERDRARRERRARWLARWIDRPLFAAARWVARTFGPLARRVWPTLRWLFKWTERIVGSALWWLLGRLFLRPLLDPTDPDLPGTVRDELARADRGDPDAYAELTQAEALAGERYNERLERLIRSIEKWTFAAYVAGLTTSMLHPLLVRPIEPGGVPINAPWSEWTPTLIGLAIYGFGIVLTVRLRERCWRRDE